MIRRCDAMIVSSCGWNFFRWKSTSALQTGTPPRPPSSPHRLPRPRPTSSKCGEKVHRWFYFPANRLSVYNSDPRLEFFFCRILLYRGRLLFGAKANLPYMWGGEGSSAYSAKASLPQNLEASLSVELVARWGSLLENVVNDNNNSSST